MAHKTRAFDELVQRTIDEWKVPGLSIAVVQGDEIYAKVLDHCPTDKGAAHHALGLRIRDPTKHRVHHQHTLRLRQCFQDNHRSSCRMPRRRR
jgi:hypothetical protein